MLSRTIFSKAVLLRATSSKAATSSSIRNYGSTGGKGDSNTHGGQSPTERNMGETGSASPSSDDVAKSDGAFNSDPNPKSASEKVDSDLPQGESMKNTASNAAMSKQFSSEEKDVPRSQSSSNNKSTDSEGGRRSQRGPGSDV